MPGTSGTRITDVLYGEHGPLYALFAHLEESAPSWELADLLLAGRCLEAALLSHARVEDDLLFGALDRRMPPDGPVAQMRLEHDEIDAELARLREAETEAAGRRALASAIALAREHFLKEEQILFPLADEMLGREESERLCQSWAERRGVSAPSFAPL
jgi:iron-sulfur cluster repair protein YtfE (RIC family)